MKIRYFIALALASTAVHAADDHYCSYTTEKAESDRVLQQSPKLQLGLGQTGTGDSRVLGIGVTESISGYLKGNLTGEIGQNDCMLYQLTNELQKHVSYDSVRITKRILEARLAADNRSVVALTYLADQVHNKVVAGTATKIQLDTINAAIARLDLDRNHVNEQLAGLIVPDMDNHTPVASIIQDLMDLSSQQQRLIASQAKKDNWDAQVTVGQGSNPNYPMFSGRTQTFANLNFTYSFGAPARNRHLDNAASSYGAWQHDQETGPIHLAELLRESVVKTRDAATTTYSTNVSYEDLLRSQLEGLGDNTAAQEAFGIQLTIELATADVETQVSKTTMSVMSQYLLDNFK